MTSTYKLNRLSLKTKICSNLNWTIKNFDTEAKTWPGHLKRKKIYIFEPKKREFFALFIDFSWISRFRTRFIGNLVEFAFLYLTNEEFGSFGGILEENAENIL